MAAEDDYAEMRKFIVSVFRQSDDVGILTVKFLRNKFLEKLGKTSLEPEKKQQFKEIVHDVFLSFSPKKQDSPHKTKDFSPLKKQTGFKEVTSEKNKSESVSKYQYQSEKEVCSSDASEKQSPQKKKRRMASSDEWIGGENDKCSIISPHQSDHNGMKNSKQMKISENGADSKTPGKEKCKSSKKSLSRKKLSSQKSKQNGKPVEKSKQEPSIYSESSDSESNNNLDHYEKSFNEDAEDDISTEEMKVSGKGTDHDIQNVREESIIYKETHTNNTLAKRNKKLHIDSSGEESLVESVKDESDQEAVEGNSYFKLSLEKDSRSDDNSDFSGENDESLKSVSSKHKFAELQESDDASDLSEESNKKLKENHTKKRNRVKSSGKHRKSSNEAEDSAKLRNLKRYVRACGMHIKKYAALFEGCRSMVAKERRLESYIRDNMEIEGRITLEKCKKAREVMEEAKELAELDTTNIIKGDSGGRPRRACQSWYSNMVEMMPKATSPVVDNKKIFSRLKGIVDSDSESEKEDEQEETDHESAQESSGEENVDPKQKRRILSDSEDED